MVEEEVQEVESEEDKEEDETLTGAVNTRSNYEAQMRAMADLYGSDRAKKVYAEEVLLQRRFDDICDEQEPKMWPCIPLNL